MTFCNYEDDGLSIHYAEQTKQGGLVKWRDLEVFCEQLIHTSINHEHTVSRSVCSVV